MLCMLCSLSFVPGKCHLTPVPQEGIKDISFSCIFTNQKAPKAPKQPTWLIALSPVPTFA